MTGNHVFRTTDEGISWEEISPDLTRNDVDTGVLGRSDHKRQHRRRGLLHDLCLRRVATRARCALGWNRRRTRARLARNGKTWDNVTPPALPEWTLISMIEASPHDAGSAYVAATRYKLDDFAPYVFKTTDYGATWTRITADIPENVFVRVMREDPTRRGLLYAGTETGVFVSYDDGGTWRPAKGNLPTVPIHDLVVKQPEGDLVLATHGRSFWTYDDLGPIRELPVGHWTSNRRRWSGHGQRCAT